MASTSNLSTTPVTTTTSAIAAAAATTIATYVPEATTADSTTVAATASLVAGNVTCVDLDFLLPDLGCVDVRIVGTVLASVFLLVVVLIIVCCLVCREKRLVQLQQIRLQQAQRRVTPMRTAASAVRSRLLSRFRAVGRRVLAVNKWLALGAAMKGSKTVCKIFHCETVSAAVGLRAVGTCCYCIDLCPSIMALPLLALLQ